VAAPRRLIVDANIVVAAFLRDSTVRRLLTLSVLEFLAPEVLWDELAKHLPELRRRSGLSVAAAREVTSLLRKRIDAIPPEALLANWDRARAIMDPIDPGDVAYLAAAMSVPCDGIWSDDPDLGRQTSVPCWTTRELLDVLRGGGLEV
jgi:predicted nucleic acid-binding protein